MIDENRPIIDVANKCDLVQSDLIPKNAIAVSATTLIGALVQFIIKRYNLNENFENI